MRLSVVAQEDFRSILEWTERNFGLGQLAVYQLAIHSAVSDLRDGPEALRSVSREDISAGIRTLRVARRGRRASHVLVYRVIDDGLIEVMRILHDAMDLPGNFA